MGRLARVVLPGVIHHVTQRGVRSMNIFLEENDRNAYMSILHEQSDRVGLEFIGYCLMDNHIHLLVIPSKEDSLRRGIGEAHRLYTRFINFRTKTRGHLFQGRFFSCPLDDSHFLAAARYVERNPVRAGICRRARDYPWSSARFNTGIVNQDPLIRRRHKRIGQSDKWSDWLSTDPDNIDQLRLHFRVGRPLGSESFIKQAESVTGRALSPKKAGRPKTRKLNDIF